MAKCLKDHFLGLLFLIFFTSPKKNWWWCWEGWFYYILGYRTKPEFDIDWNNSARVSWKRWSRVCVCWDTTPKKLHMYPDVHTQIHSIPIHSYSTVWMIAKNYPYLWYYQVLFFNILLSYAIASLRYLGKLQTIWNSQKMTLFAEQLTTFVVYEKTVN